MKLTVTQAREIARQPFALVQWRPNPNLPENEQYCVVLEKPKREPKAR